MRKTATVILMVLLSHFCLTVHGQVKSTPPNIIMFLSDDHGAEDAGCYGNPDLKTPVIDQLAKEGMIFTNAFAPVSVCTPSRAAMFTGLYPHRNGCHKNHGEIRGGVKTLPDYLKPLGYRVVLAGKRHIAPEEQFDFEYIERHEVPEFLSKIGDEPFCLIISFNAPHQPYFNQKGGYGKVTPKPWMPATEETLEYVGAYYDHVDILDHQIGTQLYWIEKYGFSDALQIYTSDHGAAFPFAKWTLYNQGIRVPLIVKWAGKISAGTDQNAMISLVDILPTLLDAAGGQVAENLDGKSLLPLLFNQKTGLHEYIYATYTNLGVGGANKYPIRAIMNEDFKLIVNLEHENKFQIRRMDTHDERTIVDAFMVLSSWLAKKDTDPAIYQRAIHHWHRPFMELYHVKEDPYELHNLSDAAAYQEVKSHLFHELARWMQTQNDPAYNKIKILSKKRINE